MSIVCSLVKTHEIVQILVAGAVPYFRNVASAVGILGCSRVQAARVRVQTGECAGRASKIAAINTRAFAAIS